MGIVLVVAGNHRQFTGWMKNVYGRSARTMASPPRYIARYDQLYGITAADVDAFHQVGTYWDNPAWGSDVYRLLHEEGHHLGKAWAMEWDLDWRKSCAMRDPLTAEDLAESRRRLIELERELSDG